MKTQTLFALLALSAACAALDNDDVPQACRDTCQGLIDVTNSCDNTTDGDQAEKDCVCLSGNVDTLFNNCAVCMKQNGMSSSNDNDVAEWMTKCGLSWNDVSSTAAISSLSASMPSISDVSTTTAPTATGVTTTITTSDSALTSTITSNSANTPSSSLSTDAAPAATVAIGGLLAGLAVGLPVLL